jgi:uncharacterized caspase-like protein
VSCHKERPEGLTSIAPYQERLLHLLSHRSEGVDRFRPNSTPLCRALHGRRWLAQRQPRVSLEDPAVDGYPAIVFVVPNYARICADGLQSGHWIRSRARHEMAAHKDYTLGFDSRGSRWSVRAAERWRGSCHLIEKHRSATRSQPMRLFRNGDLSSLVALALVLTVQLGAGTGKAASTRKAFVVGNSNYAYAQSLSNPVNDARGLAARLQTLGYQVSLGLDVGRAQFLSSFQDFAGTLGGDDFVLFYYAGHGLQIGGENYLFPVDARIDDETDARLRLVPLNALLADLSRTTHTRIIILDACRNNPFSEQIAQAQRTRAGGVTRGLARVYAGVGSFIAFSTQPGNVALDGTGQNSPFTDALLRHIAVPGVDVHGVMRRVRADVQRSTGEQQVPWESSSLVEEVSFTQGIPSPEPRPAPEPKRQPPAVENYHYVSGLDPQGDNFLALKSGPGVSYPRIATMGPDTLLKVVGSQGVWKQVMLLDGSTGWAHGNWIYCCRTVTSQPWIGLDVPRVPTGETCEDLWRRRNAIWHRYRYCFTTTKGQQTFGNSGCIRDLNAARAAMSSADLAEVEALAAREQQMGCH